MTNAEKFKKVFGISITHRRVTSDKWLFAEYQGTPTIPLSVIEDIKAEIKECDGMAKSEWIRKEDALEIIDRKVNEVTNGQE